MASQGSEVGWRFVVPPPDKCPPGLIPYPLIIHGPKTPDRLWVDGMYYELDISLHRIIENSNQILLIKQYPTVKGKGWGSIEMEKVELVLDNIEVDDPGLYKLKTCYNVYANQPSDQYVLKGARPKRRIVIDSEPFEVKTSYDNFDIHLEDDQIILINQAMDEIDGLRKLYGDLVTKIKVNSR